MCMSKIALLKPIELSDNSVNELPDIYRNDMDFNAIYQIRESVNELFNTYRNNMT